MNASQWLDEFESLGSTLSRNIIFDVINNILVMLFKRAYECGELHFMQFYSPNASINSPDVHHLNDADFIFSIISGD